MAHPELSRTDRSTVHRLTDRASYERAAAHAILDEGIVAHVGIAVDGQPYVIPMVYGRDADRLLLHGSVASRLLRRLDDGLRVCVTVTLLDGLVFARSAFHHSANYRSVVVLGEARRLTDPDEAARALDVIVDHVAPGRAAEARPPSALELRQTSVLELPIDEASVKSRSGDPKDEAEDMTLPIWAGVLPLASTAGAPSAAADLETALDVSPSVRDWRRPGSRPS